MWRTEENESSKPGAFSLCVSPPDPMQMRFDPQNGMLLKSESVLARWMLPGRGLFYQSRVISETDGPGTYGPRMHLNEPRADTRGRLYVERARGYKEKLGESAHKQSRSCSVTHASAPLPLRDTQTHLRVRQREQQLTRRRSYLAVARNCKLN